MQRLSLDRFAAFIRHQGNGDKQLREELFALVAMIRFWKIPDDATVEIGGETKDFDGRLNGHTIEVVQALPDDEHKLRHELPSGASPATMLIHSQDHLQFPDAIVAAIKQKQAKHYADQRWLCVVVDGDYTEEDDSIIETWIVAVRNQVKCNPFIGIFLVERARRLAFPMCHRDV